VARNFWLDYSARYDYCLCRYWLINIIRLLYCLTTNINHFQYAIFEVRLLNRRERFDNNIMSRFCQIRLEWLEITISEIII
jgi:hypothetical protein